MSFHSLDYLIFLPLAVAAYFLTAPRLRWTILLASSVIFYASWRIEFLALILFSTVIDYCVALLLQRIAVAWQRRALLAVSLVGNLGLLSLFKFFTQTANEWFSAAFIPGEGTITPMLFLLPLGISFYTFQTLGYTIDVYRGKREAERHFGHFAVYVTFFPQLIAGPIERASQLMPQLHAVHRWDWLRAGSGCALILVGLYKKLVVADALGAWLAEGAGQGENSPLGWTMLSLGTVYRYYADLSGYADIAIGSALILGIRLSQNFRRPLASGSVTAFWQNWHITVSRWFRDYLFVPLAKRTSRYPFGRSLAVILAMLVVGVWHGATINWLLVGLVGGVIISISNAVKKAVGPSGGSPATRCAVRWGEFCILWLYLPFIGALVLTHDFGAAMALLREIAKLPASLLHAEGWSIPPIALYLPLAIIALELFSWLDQRKPVLDRLRRGKRWAAPLFYLMLTATILVLGTYDNPDFLYFQF